MKKFKHSTMAILGVLFCALTSFRAGGPSPRPAQHRAIRTIIIDPGHGGFDTGTKGLQITEKEVVLAIGLKLGALINEAFPDIKIVYTRTTEDRTSTRLNSSHRR